MNLDPASISLVIGPKYPAEKNPKRKILEKILIYLG